MTREIERKFIISKIPNSLPKIKIKQGYLQTDKDRTVRIRSISDEKGLLKNILTIKGPSSKNGMSRLEYETTIPNKNAKELFNLCYAPLIKRLGTYICMKEWNGNLTSFMEPIKVY